MNQEMILNGYVKSGTGYSSFLEEFRSFSNTIKIVKTKGTDITFLSLCNTIDYQREGKLVFYVLNNDTMESFPSKGERFPIGSLSKDLFTPKVIKELKETTGLVLTMDKVKYIMSDFAIPSFAKWAGLGGDQTIKRQNVYRNVHLADAALNSKKNSLYFITREVTIERNDNPIKINKIMAVMGEQFVKESTEFLPNILKRLVKKSELGKCSVYRWQLTQKYTDIRVEFPMIAEELKKKYQLQSDIIPGIWFRTSDIGASSFCVRAVIRKGRHFAIIDEKSFRHVKELEEDMIMQAVSSMFESYEKYAQNISILEKKEIMDYSKIDLSSEKGCIQNYETIRKFFVKTIEKAYGKLQISSKRKNTIATLMTNAINSSKEYSFGMIMEEMYSMPEYISDLDENTVTEMRRMVGQIVNSLAKTYPELSAT